MEIALGVLLIVINLACVLLVVVGLPGTWLMATATLLVAWLRWDTGRGWNDQMIGLPMLVAVVALAVVSEVVEFIGGMHGARKAGASGWGTFGALIGAVIGGIAATFLIPIPILGSLIGACGGAAIGAGVAELVIGRNVGEAYRSGIGAGVGRFAGTVLKLAVAVVMWVVIAVAVFWP